VLKSSSSKKIKSIFKSKRESLIMTTVLNEELSCRAIALRHEVSRMTLLKWLKEERTMNDFSKNRQLLSKQEETIILRFVDEFIALRFFLRIYMIEEKVIFLLRKREVSNLKLKRHWIRRFLKRHSEYRTKFSRHLDQERHWSSDSTVFVQWFDLMRKTMIKYNIAIEDVYNMNEKKYMMKMSEATQWVIFSSHCLIFFRICSIFLAFLVYSSHFETISRDLIEFEKMVFLK
jgi:transposase